MNLKFVYVIVSGKDDYYAEQALISIYSLRKYNSNAQIVAVADSESEKLFTGKRALIKSYASEVIIADVPSALNNFQKSRYIKTTLRKLISGDFVYIDSDTVIQGDLGELSQIKHDIALARHIEYTKPGFPLWVNLLKFYNKDIGAPEDENYGITEAFNGGVMLCRDTEKCHVFFDRWHALWYEDSVKYSYHWDQPSLWRANAMSGNIIGELVPIYNCRVIYPQNALRYLTKSKIFHYTITSDRAGFIMGDKKFFDGLINESGDTRCLDDFIENLKERYLNAVEVVDASEYDKLQSDFNDLKKDYDYLQDEKKILRGLPLVNIAETMSYKFPFITKILRKFKFGNKS